MIHIAWEMSLSENVSIDKIYCLLEPNFFENNTLDESMLHIKQTILLITLFICRILALSILEESQIEEAWVVLNDESQIVTWPVLSAVRATAIRSQRDVAANTSVLNNIGAGVNMKTVLFDTFGYNKESLVLFNDLMNMGVQTFQLDLYYNQFTQSWLLCPETELRKAMSNSSNTECVTEHFSPYTLMETTNSFIKNTDNDLNVNTVFFLLKLHMIYVASNNTNDQKYLRSNVTSLELFSQTEKVVSPGLFSVFGVPTFHALFFKYFMRVFLIILENNLTTTVAAEQLQSFYPTFFVASTINTGVAANIYLQDFYVLEMQYEPVVPNEDYTSAEMSITNALSFNYDSQDSPYSMESYWGSIRSGYNPIINHSFSNLSDISRYLELSSWAFSPLQPTTTQIDELDISGLFNKDQLLNGNLFDSPSEIFQYPQATSNISASDIAKVEDSESLQFINRCAVITKFGWVATDCTRKLRFLCKNSRNSSDFIWGDDIRNYMTAASYCKHLEGNYELSLPTNVYENTQLVEMIPEDVNYIWINLNSLSTKNCWVVGLNTDCPYQKVVSRRIFAGMISPSAAVAFVLFVLLITMQFQRIDVHKNRKHWKKVMNESNKINFDGIPA